MKISCSVEVINRLLPSLSISGKRSVRSNLIIGKLSDKEVFILHQTNENSQGKRYKVKDNITNVFVKFVNEGKATIRFKIPEHDLAIKCDPIQLKGFLRTLKLVMGGHPLPQLSTVQTNTLLKPIKPVKKNLKILSKEDYPVREGFPRTLESLHINGLNQKVLDNRILRLRNIRCLNLVDNSLTTLPVQIGSSLPNLVELHLGKNCLGHSKDWRWIVNRKLQESLKLLDLESNQISFLPDKTVNMKRLVTLKLDHNMLKELPNGIGRMKSLRYLHISDNQIRFLPGSIIGLNLESIDMSHNAFTMNMPMMEGSGRILEVPHLVDIAAFNVLKYKLDFSPDTLPLTLIDHLSSMPFCACGLPCITPRLRDFLPYVHFSKATEITTSDNEFLEVCVQRCSDHCNKFKYTK